MHGTISIASRTATFWPRRSHSPPRIARGSTKGCGHQSSLVRGGVVGGYVRVRRLLVHGASALRRAASRRVRLTVRACFIRRPRAASTPFVRAVRFGASGVLRRLLGGRLTAAHLGCWVQDGRRSRWWRALRRQRSSHVYSGVRACGRGATATATGAGAGVLLCSSQTACLARCESGSGDTMLPACQTSSPRASSQCATLPDGRATTWRAGRRDSGKGGAEHSSSLGGRSGTYLGFNVGTAPLQFLLPKPAAVVSPSTCRRNPERGAMQERRAAR